PIDTPFPEPSTSSGTSSRPGERYKMAGFSQDLPTSSYQLNSTSPQTILQRLNTTSTNSPSSSSSEIDIMRNRVLQMQVLAMTEKESSEHWRREAEDNHRLAVQLEHEKNRAIQQRDDALHQIEHMRHLLVQNNARLLPSDHDLMKLPLDDVRLLQTQLQQELTKLALIEQAKSNNVQQTPPTDNSPGTPTSNSSPRQRQHKQNHGKHVLSSEHWRREAEDNHRLAVQLEHEKNRAIQQRDDALHQIEHMRHLLVQNNARLLPSDHDLMKLPLDDVRLLQTQLQQELTKLALIEQAKSNNVQQTPPTDNSPGTPTSNSSPRQRQHKQNHGKHVLV
ncbi:unnamed protein product, partial [Adineta steineri]